RAGRPPRRGRGGGLDRLAHEASFCGGLFSSAGIGYGRRKRIRHRIARNWLPPVVPATPPTADVAATRVVAAVCRHVGVRGVAGGVTGWRAVVRVTRGRSVIPGHVNLRLRRGGAERQRTLNECRCEAELAHRAIHGELSHCVVLGEQLEPAESGDGV